MTDLIVTRWGARGFSRVWPCAIGRSGITETKTEGDGATPAGPLMITGCLYRPDRIAHPPPWANAIGPRDIWCDDPDHPLYNLQTNLPLRASYEKLRRPDPLYDLVLTTNWNGPIAKPGKGSAIFLHAWRKPRHPTEGCIAFARHDMTRLAHLLAPGAQIYLRP